MPGDQHLRTTLALSSLLCVACAAPSGREGRDRVDLATLLEADPLLGTWMERPAPATASAPRAATRWTAPPTPAAEPDARLRAKLAATRLPGIAFAAPPDLEEAAATIGRLAGVDVVVRPAAADVAEGTDALAALEREQPISAAAALDLLCELAGDEVAWTTRHGLVLATTREDARTAPRLVMSPVADLVRPVRSFAAREMGVFPSGFEPELESAEFGVIDSDTLVGLIRDTIAPGTWDDPGVLIEVVNGVLIVRH